MSTDSRAASASTPPALGPAHVLVRLALIGLALAAVAATFLYLRGWFTPKELTPAKLINGFEEVDGTHSGFRRNHAKGLCVSGFFESNGQGVRRSKAAVFPAGRVPVLGRFSLSGGQPYAADKADTVRGLGLQFTLPNGEFWRTAMVNLPVFPFKTPQAFYEHMLAAKPDPQTGKPDMDKLKAFIAAHPETAQALTIIKGQPMSSGFDNSSFSGLNAFRCVNAAGGSVPVRWGLVSEQPFVAASTDVAGKDKNFLFDALIAQIHRQPLRWRLVLTIGQAGDSTNDATLPWPAGRERVDVGMVTLERAESEETSPARDINFDPLVLPAGITPSDDPLLSARSAAYSQSFTRRAGEAKEPSAITPAEVGDKK